MPFSTNHGAIGFKLMLMMQGYKTISAVCPDSLRGTLNILKLQLQPFHRKISELLILFRSLHQNPLNCSIFSKCLSALNSVLTLYCKYEQKRWRLISINSQ